MRDPMIVSTAVIDGYECWQHQVSEDVRALGLPDHLWMVWHPNRGVPFVGADLTGAFAKMREAFPERLAA